ncbi:MAG: CPBP family intramembrane metalloprotease [Oscillatoriales cyanobacterium RM2_1_1]|nr:CPBP family intramembrane metalloprotease [Oscillatoriales cyanobacterium SM2_3_0]NJO47720.1 CPBP family intramembrane metalloprotease [Oscillatoriales cyanobacterium RM2_1_1]
MNLRRLILLVLTLAAIAVVGSSLINSWTQPQVQSRLELYQTNLVLHAAEWQDSAAQTELTALQKGLLGDDGFASALKQYEKAQESVQETLEEAQTSPESLAQTPEQLQKIAQDLALKTGLLQVHQGDSAGALVTWKELIDNTTQPQTSTAETAQVLVGLWGSPAQILSDAEAVIRRHLEGWFQYQALSQLYTLQQRQDALQSLQVKEQTVAQEALLKLAIISAIPGLGLVLGLILLVFLGVQWLRKRQDSLIAQNANLPWKTPWTAETVLQVFVVGFFFLGQVVIPLLFQAALQRFNLQPGSLTARTQAELVFVNYGLLALGGLLVLYFSIRPSFPLPGGWFRFDWRGGWIGWGLGGYAVALPLVILVSLVNQQLWDGQGGSNPILPIALENRDQVALIIFLVTASVAAPVFEEIMFRGFLLPSLTRYMSVSGAIALSSVLFALAHLNVSEVLPLATLGIVLGVVYTRSRNLLSSILLHSLWNSGTLLSLYILGSGVG